MPYPCSQSMTRDHFNQLSWFFYVVDEGNHPPWPPVEVEASDRNSSASALIVLHVSLEDYSRQESLEISGVICNCDQPRQACMLRGKVYKFVVSDGPSCCYRQWQRSSLRAIINFMDTVDLFHKGNEFHTDNWYTSPTFFYYLQSQGTNATGTVDFNKKFMPTILWAKAHGDVDRQITPTGILTFACNVAWQACCDNAVGCPH